MEAQLSSELRYLTYGDTRKVQGSRSCCFVGSCYVPVVRSGPGRLRAVVGGPCTSSFAARQRPTCLCSSAPLHKHTSPFHRCDTLQLPMTVYRALDVSLFREGFGSGSMQSFSDRLSVQVTISDMFLQRTNSTYSSIPSHQQFSGVRRCLLRPNRSALTSDTCHGEVYWTSTWAVAVTLRFPAQPRGPNTNDPTVRGTLRTVLPDFPGHVSCLIAACP